MSNKVLVIAGAIAGGVGKHVFDLINGLNREFNIFFAFSTEDGDGDYSKKIDDIRRTLNEGNLLPLKICKRPGIDDIKNVMLLRKFVAKHGIALIHGHGAKGGAYARLTAICHPEVKVIYTPHGGAVHSAHGLIGDLVYGFIEKTLYHYTDCYLFESAYSQVAFFQKVGGSPASGKCLVNHNGIDCNSLSAPASAANLLAARGLPYDWLKQRTPADVHCCCIAFVRPIKGQSVLLKAWKGVLEKVPDAHLHLLGPVADPDGLEALIRELGIQNRVHIYGDVPNARLLLSVYDYCLIPSLFESFGYVAVEAMCEGVPVIASRTGGLPEIIDHNHTGFLIEAGNPVAWTEALCQVFKDNTFASSWIASARADARTRFSLQTMLKTISNVYREQLPLDPEI